MKFKSIATLLAFLVLTACSDGRMQEIEDRVTNKDPRNKNVSFKLNNKDNTLRYCLVDLDNEGAALDVFRVFLNIADELKEKTFESIELCYKDTTKYILSGIDFKVIGEEYEIQNPTYTIRTFPEKLTLPDGQAAFKKHHGGVLYVMREQMADFNKMNQHWFLSEILSELESKKEQSRPKTFAPDEDVF